MNKTYPLLGILGGLGPMSTFYFCELLTAHTAATCDADHIDMIISSRATTPDRTAFILGNSREDPLPVMRREALRLTRAGAGLLVIPCNNAHYFYDGLKKDCPVPILNIIGETVGFLKSRGVNRFGLLATEGTVRSDAYGGLCRSMGMECLYPTPAEQAEITGLIYRDIKQNRPVDLRILMRIADSLQKRGCERLVLGCTELSLLKPQLPQGDLFVDSLEILAMQTILACGKHPVGFSFAPSGQEAGGSQ
ncbi:MAG: aspartate/glutamate racemase family protein [Clostridia bacterium]|nr:aspartate/glutamate racemase family protein [Clostridia bacterium]